MTSLSRGWVETEDIFGCITLGSFNVLRELQERRRANYIPYNGGANLSYAMRLAF